MSHSTGEQSQSTVPETTFQLGNVFRGKTRQTLKKPQCYLTKQHLKLVDPAKGIHWSYSTTTIRRAFVEDKKPLSMPLFSKHAAQIHLGNDEVFILEFQSIKERSIFLETLARILKTRDEKTVSGNFGVAGFIRSRKEEMQYREGQLNSAFQDLDSLMLKAKELVRLAEKYEGALLESNVGEEKAEVIEFRNIAASLGVDNPVKRARLGGKGDDFHRKLAMELYRTIEQPLRQNGGILNLIDVYCWIIRARTTTQLISPEDLLAACEMFDQLNIPIHLERFESGVIIVVAGFMKDDEVCQVILENVQERRSLSAVEYASMVNIPVLRAISQLELCEQKGMLCRDESHEEIRFFPNLYFV
eukprot:jgi/Galph1/4100/GphlegSOOS_G2753.1